MEKRIKTYLKFLSSLDLKAMEKDGLYKLRDEVLIQIGFFQHERLIHLIVTVTFAVLTLISLFACVAGAGIPCMILTALFFILLIPYVRHYYILENSVQKMYRYYDDIVSKLSDPDTPVFNRSEENH